MSELVADRIFALIKPYYKGMYRASDGLPEFKKSLRPSEINDLLVGLHNIVVEVKTGRLVA